MLYRILQTLTVHGGRRVEAGSVDALSELVERAPANLTILMERGIIVPVSAPPMTAINEEWRRIAAKLEKHGIIKLDEFIAATDIDLRRWLRLNTTAIGELKAAARILLQPE